MKLPNNVDFVYIQTLINFIIYNNYAVHDCKICLQTSGIPQGGYYSSMLVNLFLYHFEWNCINDNLQLYRYIGDIILISFDNANCSFPVKYPAYLT